MSHAAVLVAPTKERIAKQGIDNAIAWEMGPFSENDECFADGSRWDWYTVGGRFTGMLSTYEPLEDSRNQETCKTCNGTGIRPGGREQFGEEWFNGCNGCNGCHGKGTHVKVHLEKFSGDIVQVKNINLEQLRKHNIESITKYFHEARVEKSPFGPKPETTLEEYLEQRGAEFPVSAYAFLRNRHWNEAERMGWFGISTYTECERKDMDRARANPDAWFGKCLHKDEATGARIVCWNEPWELWAKQYYNRFIAKLDPSETVAVVDYHV